MKRLPNLWRVKRAGAEIGAWHITVKGKRINLRTDDRPLAVERRKQAAKGQRTWPTKMSRNPTRGAAFAELAALGEVAPAENHGDPKPVIPDAGGGGQPLPPANGMPVLSAMPEPERVDAEPLPPEQHASPKGWADDLNSAAGAAAQSETEADPTKTAPPLRFTDLPWFEGALVTASKLAVGAQVNFQALCMRWIGDVEAGRVGPPPMKEPDSAESFAAFQKKLSTPWEPDDPRELGRQIYHGFLKRVCPDELPVPDWILAPIVVAVCTLPVQIAGSEKRAKDAAQAEGTPDARATA